MKKATIAFIGVLACVLSVSCEDKLLDNGKNNSPENSDGDSYESVLDSSFQYVDGILDIENHNTYTENGLLESATRKRYNPDGSLYANEVSEYTYSDSQGKNYVCIGSRNGVESYKKEAYYSGTRANHVSQTKEYAKHGGEWFLKSDVYVKTDNFRGHGYNFSYMIFNGQRIAVQRVVLLDGLQDPDANVMLYLDRTTYYASYSTDPSDPDGLTISSLGSGTWRKTIQRNNSQGVTLFKEDFLSGDSITWRTMGGNEAECDINGNVVYEGYISANGKTYGKRYNKYSDDNRIISSYHYEFGDSKEDSLLSSSKVFYYSEAGVLDSAVIVFNSNTAGKIPIDFAQLSSNIFMGMGRNNISGAKYVALFDANGNLVKETMYQMNQESGEMENTPCAYCTITYDSADRCTGYVVYVSDNGEWVEVETGNSVYNSKGKELSSHVIYTGLPEGAAKLDNQPTKETYYESISKAEYDSYGNLSYKMKEVSYSRLSFNYADGTPIERNKSEKTEEYYSTVKVK